MKLEINPDNRKYYSDDFIKGFECGVDRQYEEDNKKKGRIMARLMTEEKNNSKTMCMIKMLPLLQYAFPEIKNAFYYVDQETQDELVCIQYRVTLTSDITGKPYEKQEHFEVNVNCDSVMAMIDDVWRQCRRRFG